MSASETDNSERVKSSKFAVNVPSSKFSKVPPISTTYKPTSNSLVMCSVCPSPLRCWVASSMVLVFPLITDLLSLLKISSIFR